MTKRKNPGAQHWPQVLIRLDPDDYAHLENRALHFGTSKAGEATRILVEAIRESSGRNSQHAASGSSMTVSEIQECWNQQDGE